MSAAVFRVVQFVAEWNGHKVGDRKPVQDWLADELVRQGKAQVVVAEVFAPSLQKAPSYNLT